MAWVTGLSLASAVGVLGFFACAVRGVEEACLLPGAIAAIDGVRKLAPAAAVA